ncbi:Alpha-maltose-1-phosphate synthase [Nocardioides aquaticus]|uniref:Alpha-maltose-1-phosphate synthase n=1 Tax=Nocardioides aquaticus TaxID=160826 RepID=A0ABX8ED72_9ACTN|nr:glycosyltransferase family 1 protein [Nocardioides aquaticus]QVT78417.1 Alpha-maltose-1-phosphate synthase [Nocardioides aquaticus]
MSGGPLRSVVVNGRFLAQDVTGVQRVGREILHALDELIGLDLYPGVEFEVVVPRATPDECLPRLEHLRLRRAGRLQGHLWEQLELPLIAGDRTLLCLGNLAPVLRLLRGARPTATMVHDLSYRYFPDAYSRAFRALYSVVIPVVLARSTVIVTVSESEKVSILRHYPRLARTHRLHAVQNGGGVPSSMSATTGASFTPIGAAVSGDDEQVVLYVGSLTRRKNADGLRRIADRLTSARPVRFVFAGATAGVFSGLDSGGAPAPSSPRIEFLGQVNDPHVLEELYRRASVFVFPSFYEASPLPPVEAMSAGTPVVASDIPSLRERCGDAVTYVEPHDIDGFVNEIGALLDDPALRDSMAERGRARAAAYSWRAQTERLVELLGVEQ